jgi:sulfite dehydrogenase (cytochrome) subunit B
MRSGNYPKLRLAIPAMILGLAVTVLAQQKSIQLPSDNPVSQLKPGPGANLASSNCAICHSVDYIIRQPPRSPEQWDGEVQKMITVFGAPINAANAKTIAEYLAANYSPQNAAPARPAAAPARPRN